MKTVQYTHRQCGQRYEKQVRKYDAVQLDCLGLSDVFSGKQVDYGGRKDHPEDRDYSDNESQGPEKPVRKFPNLLFSVFPHVGGEDRDKRSGHRALSHQATK